MNMYTLLIQIPTPAASTTIG